MVALFLSTCATEQPEVNGGTNHSLQLPHRVFLAKANRLLPENSLPVLSKTAVVESAAYVDVMDMQKMLLLVYLPLPIFLAMLVSEVCLEKKRVRRS